MKKYAHEVLCMAFLEDALYAPILKAEIFLRVLIVMQTQRYI